MLAASEQTRQRMTAQDYAALPVSNTPCELIDGEIVTMPSPSDSHQRLVMELLLLIKAVMPAGTLRFAPLDVHLDAHNVVQPDLFWVAQGSPRCLPVDGKYWQGAPDLVVEVLSEGTAKRDKMDKFWLYQAHGVREYWIVNGHEGFMEVWQHNGQAFAFFGVFDGSTPFTSPLLQATIHLASVLAGGA